MAQLSLYIDEETLRKIELAAKIEKTSLSKWVVSRLKDAVEGSWPRSFGELFGSIEDETFTVPEKMTFDSDSKREYL